MALVAAAITAYSVDKAFRSDNFKDALGVVNPMYGQYRQGKLSLEAQKKAQDQATAQARDQATKAERDFNRFNQKRPDLAALLAGNMSAASGGAGSTMLTGPSGVDMSTLKLGKTSLLGS